VAVKNSLTRIFSNIDANVEASDRSVLLLQLFFLIRQKRIDRSVFICS